MSKTKNVIKEKMEKGKEWLKENRELVGFWAGGAVAAVGYLVAEKIFEPKKVAIGFGHGAKNPDGVLGEVWVKDRFGKGRKFVTVDYGTGNGDETLKKICDSLNEIVYPGD